MNQTFQQNMAIVSGAAPALQPQLSQADKDKMAKSYFQMYFGLAMVNWLNGGTLGAAWHRALGQMNAFATGSTGNNPATMYLRQIHAAHRARWAQVMMQNPNREKTLQTSPEQKREWMTLANRDVSTAMASANEITGRFKTNEKQPMQAAQYMDAQKKMQMMIQMRIMQNQNGSMAA